MSNHRVHDEGAYEGTTPQMRYWRKRVLDRKAMGLCPRCAGVPKAVREGYSLCDEHLGKQRAYYKPKRGGYESN